jgi:Glycine transporter
VEVVVIGQEVIASGITIGGFKWTGDFTTIDLIAAGTNALNGALLARRPDHYKNFTIVGILLMALLGGIGGGVTRDVILNKIPGAFTNPAYILLCLAAGIIGYLIALSGGQLFREGLFQFMTSFSLPWYAIAGAQAAETAHLPVLGGAGSGGNRPDRRPVVHRREQRRAPQAVHPRGMVRHDRRIHRPDMDNLRRGRAEHLVVGWDFLRHRLHRPPLRPVRGLGRAAGQGTRGRLSALRRSATSGSQDRRQIPT